jgi:type IV pilus assembly protein PilQ
VQAATPATTTSIGNGQPPAAGGRQYVGHPVSLDFQGADLRAVLRTFAEISGLNIVIDPTVNGTVDVALRDVPWDQALDIILRANKLGYSIDGTIVRISPISVLASEEKERSDLAKAQIETSQVSTITRQLSYAKGEEIVALLKQASILSQRGQAFVDPRTNTLIVTDLSDRLAASTDLINTIDKPQPQVEIEARIVQTNKNYARQLGVQWGFGGRVDPALGNTTNLAFPNSGSLTGRTGGAQGPANGAVTGQPTAVNFPVGGASSAVGLALGSVNGAFNLDIALSALETTGNGRILSNPRVTTQNNIAAEMTQGVQIPIQVVSNNTVTVTFRDAALTLKVVPQITAANTVIMQVNLENASPDFSRAINGVPPINTQRAITSVLVNDGQTTVIGGIYVSQEQAQTDRTPGLGTIPLLKWLFKRDRIDDTNTELLVFITPRIIKS